MKLAFRLYLTFLPATLLLGALRMLLSGGGGGRGPGDDVSLLGGLLTFVVSLVLIGSGVATWASAVAIASIHRVTWPLILCVVLVVAAVGAMACAFST